MEFAKELVAPKRPKAFPRIRPNLLLETWGGASELIIHGGSTGERGGSNGDYGMFGENMFAFHRQQGAEVAGRQLFNPDTAMEELRAVLMTRANQPQRLGRIGRTGKGEYYGLYTQEQLLYQVLETAPFSDEKRSN